jgi:hypothetical protein
VRETFEVITLNYDADKKLIENIIVNVEWGLHDKSDLEVSDPSNLFGWTFFTITLDVQFIVKMVDLYEGFRNARGWTHYEKFESWLNDRLKEAGSQAKVKATIPKEFKGLF